MKLKKWELALFIALAVTLLCGTGFLRDQQQLADKIIRLHVVANSDSEEDQALKLEVRDRVLAELTPLLDGVSGRDEAVEAVGENIALLTAAAEEVIRSRGFDYSVSAGIGEENFPTREYDTFSLPAGRYESLRIEIGEGSGKNWWCVVFPPLCADSTLDAKDALEALSEDEISLITEDSAGYVVKFKTIEWFGKLRGLFS